MIFYFRNYSIFITKKNMSAILSQFKAVRHNLLQVLDQFSEKDLSIIPQGFSNNLYWNIAHCVATQQLLVYYLSGNEMIVEKFWIDNYKKGTSASSKVSDNNKQKLLDIFHLTTEQFEIDFNSKKFLKYNSYTTSFGLSLNTPDEAISFNTMHESLHFGYCLAMRKLIL